MSDFSGSTLNQTWPFLGFHNKTSKEEKKEEKKLPYFVGFFTARIIFYSIQESYSSFDKKRNMIKVSWQSTIKHWIPVPAQPCNQTK